MCEIEDLSLGHQDIYFNKYSDCFGTNNMDLYITDSLQDMLDIDIKSEMATDLGSGTDLSDTLGVNFSDLPPLLDIEMDNANSWMLGNNSALHSSSFVQNLDLYGSEANAVMVNPNSVMPSMFSESPVKSAMNDNSTDLMLNCIKNESCNSSPIASPSADSHLTFSPNTIKFASVKEENDRDSGMEGRKISDTSNFVFIKRDSVEQIKKDLNEAIDVKPKFSTISTLRVKAPNSDMKMNKNGCSILNNQRLGSPQYITTGQILGSKALISSSVQILPNRQKTYITSGSNPTTILIDNGTFTSNRQVLKTVSSSTLSESNAKFVANNKSTLNGEFPKPAYSYSCLIAMALKNSRTGSLPVSEIYNFMCQHFPYFKTAPNGWKNSVRHNLSLNKCFEKIEKPSTNGGQRKGCLWAMNPSKVGKMDEEVQKWSRKDPQAIRKAMVHPDNLEALERGEMKYCSTEDVNGGDDECSEDELDVDEMISAEDHNPDIEVIEGYEEIEVEEHTVPFKLEFSLASQYPETDGGAKRAKPTVIHRMNSSPSHSNRRKAPLVNGIA